LSRSCFKAKADERIIANKQKIDAAAKKVVPINQPSAEALNRFSEAPLTLSSEIQQRRTVMRLIVAAIALIAPLAAAA
jgi:hypothetical protein